MVKKAMPNKNDPFMGNPIPGPSQLKVLIKNISSLMEKPNVGELPSVLLQDVIETSPPRELEPRPVGDTEVVDLDVSAKDAELSKLELQVLPLLSQGMKLLEQQVVEEHPIECKPDTVGKLTVAPTMGPIPSMTSGVTTTGGTTPGAAYVTWAFIHVGIPVPLVINISLSKWFCDLGNPQPCGGSQFGSSIPNPPTGVLEIDVIEWVINHDRGYSGRSYSALPP